MISATFPISTLASSPPFPASEMLRDISETSSHPEPGGAGSTPWAGRRRFESYPWLLPHIFPAHAQSAFLTLFSLSNKAVFSKHFSFYSSFQQIVVLLLHFSTTNANSSGVKMLFLNCGLLAKCKYDQKRQILLKYWFFLNSNVIPICTRPKAEASYPVSTRSVPEGFSSLRRAMKAVHRSVVVSESVAVSPYPESLTADFSNPGRPPRLIFDSYLEWPHRPC